MHKKRFFFFSLGRSGSIREVCRKGVRECCHTTRWHEIDITVDLSADFFFLFLFFFASKQLELKGMKKLRNRRWSYSNEATQAVNLCIASILKI